MFWIWIRMDPSKFSNVDPDPHSLKKLDPDSHKSKCGSERLTARQHSTRQIYG
jgi:hypothetical protein